MGSTAESRYQKRYLICDKDGTYSSVTEIGVATNFDQFSADYYSYIVMRLCSRNGLIFYRYVYS